MGFGVRLKLALRCMFSPSVKETTVLWIFLAKILPASVHDVSILWRVDNTTALSYVRKEGGLKGRRLLLEAEKILLFLHSRRLRILPAFIPSEENLQADAASRFQLVPDWHLDSNVVHQMVSLWGTPQIDLFASRQSAQFKRFMSWRAADEPEVVDALSVVWDFKLAFLFPPIPLLKRVVRKLEVSRGVFLLVAPYWEAQTWFASLQALPVLEVRRLPFHDALVVDLVSGEPPQSLERLFLVVWKICGGLGESTPCRTGPSSLLRQDGPDPQRIDMKGSGSPSRPSCALPPYLSIKRL
jgi:hypothetical protein